MQTDGGKLHFEDCPTMAQQTNKWNSLKMQTVILHGGIYGPLSRRLDRCDHVIQNESRDPFGGNVYYVTMQITFLTRKFRNGERILHCDVVHITTKWVSSLTLDCNGVFAIKALFIAIFENASCNYHCFCYNTDLYEMTIFRDFFNIIM